MRLHRFLLTAILVLGAVTAMGQDSSNVAVWGVAGPQDGQKLTRYQMNRSSFRSAEADGSAPKSKYRMKDPKGGQMVKRGISAPKGLGGRHIAMWQSHGRYFDLKDLSWKWQRPSLFQTSEDIFTQSFLVQFLVPMLENAGANVILPRERDFHHFELISDNDACIEGSARFHGTVQTKGIWKSMDGGFADMRVDYRGEENPFTMGSVLSCKTYTKKGKECRISWHGNIPMKDEYGVYVSYKSLPKSTTDARYTVHTACGERSVSVNQRMGGGTWVYLGKFELAAGEHEIVSLSNKSSVAGVLTADAVKIGGGMGNIARGIKDSTDFRTSGLPRFAEGARYFLQWCGVPAKVWSLNEEADDYRDDLMSRGEWVQYLSGGSWVNPKHTGLKIPVDMSLAWHTDAGSRPDDSIVGTLGIYTLKSKGSTRLPNGKSRGISKDLTEMLLAQIENDLQAQWDRNWTIRDVWNKSYSESRTTGTPAVLLELLSHQNFEDMKYGLDPMFRFTASRAVYKAILKFLSLRYGCPYVVQPLPVRAFSARLNHLIPEPCAELKWKETEDSLESTAGASHFIVYTRVDDGGWDSGVRVEATRDDGWHGVSLPVKEGHIYSYKVVAANDGGLSFPSEILSVGLAAEDGKVGGPENGRGLKKITVVNAFHRVSGPKWFDSPFYAGFDNRSDSGVPYLRDWAFVGEQWEFNRSKVYKGGIDTGFGACYEDYMDRVIGGNSFDYPYMHGAVIMDAGYSFDSTSDEALEYDTGMVRESSALDIICGKECKVQTGSRSPIRGGVYSKGLVRGIEEAVEYGRGILISGAYIAKEAEEGGSNLKEFVRNALGFTLRREHGSRIGQVHHFGTMGGNISFPCAPCEESYCVESPDALSCWSMGSKAVLEYSDSHLAAGIQADFGHRRVAAFGFPLEIVSDPEARGRLIRESLEFICR